MKNGVHSPEWAPDSIHGVGIGLRMQHIDEVLETLPDIPWFELLADNHTALGGIIPRQLEAIRREYPITLHSVGMSLAGIDPLNFGYLKTLRRLHQDYEVSWISDHLCFSQHAEHQYHDLLPFPHSEESLKHVAERVNQIQDFFAEPIVVENVSRYLSYRASSLSEAQFLGALSSLTGCKILLDVNNIYVNEINHNDSSAEWFTALPENAVQEIHLAGYEDKGDYLLDAHNNKVSEHVWALYQSAIDRYGSVATLIEWDNDIPEFNVLQAEAKSADKILQNRSIHEVA